MTGGVRETAKSILQTDDDICFICGGRGASEWHHIFGGAYRSKSERYGLKVRLHHDCHNEPPNGAHHNKEVMDELHRIGQMAIMEREGQDISWFISEFGKNYL